MQTGTKRGGGRSIAPQLRGEKGSPREWAYVQLGARWYVREQGWKLNESGELFDMSDAPFTEKPVAANADGLLTGRPTMETTVRLQVLAPLLRAVVLLAGKA